MKKLYAMFLGLLIGTNIFALTYEAKIGLSNDFLEQDALYFNIGLDVYGEQRSIRANS